MGPGDSSRLLRVASWNIHHGVGDDGRLDLDRIAGTVARTQADVVALQEVDRRWHRRSAFSDQAQEIADRLTMHLTFGASVERAHADLGTPRQYGNALLSLHPVRAARTTLLPRPTRGEQRSFTDVEVTVDGVRVRLMTTHLEHRYRRDRTAQAEVVAAALADGGLPAVVLGDLNATPGSPELAPLTHVLADAWETAGTGDGHTFPSKRPGRRIDYVLVSPELEVRQVRVVPTDASDHLPVVAEIRLPAPGRLSSR